MRLAKLVSNVYRSEIMNNSDFTITPACAGLLACLQLIGCSTIDISDKERTSVEQYNGLWIGVLEKPGSVQLSDLAYRSRSRIVFTCGEIDTEIQARVNDGVITGTVDMEKEITFSSNINDRGKFYVEIPRESTYTVNGRSRFGGFEYHVFKGEFDLSGNSGSGVYISAFGSVSEGGCEYPIVFRKA